MSPLHGTNAENCQVQNHQKIATHFSNRQQQQRRMIRAEFVANLKRLIMTWNYSVELDPRARLKFCCDRFVCGHTTFQSCCKSTLGIRISKGKIHLSWFDWLVVYWSRDMATIQATQSLMLPIWDVSLPCYSLSSSISILTFSAFSLSKTVTRFGFILIIETCKIHQSYMLLMMEHYGSEYAIYFVGLSRNKFRQVDFIN